MVRPSEQYFCEPGESFVGYAWATESNAGSSHTYIFDGRGNARLSTSTVLAFLRGSSEYSHQLHRYFPLSYPVPPSPWEQPTGAPSVLRSIFQFRLRGNATTEEAADNQRRDAAQDFDHFIKHEVFPLALNANDPDRFEHVKVSFYGSDLEDYDQWHYVIADMNWFWGSFLFVAASMWLHTGSLFLSLNGIFVVLLSVAMGYALTPATSTSLVSLFALFLMMGIGCDTVFVFHEFWQSPHSRCLLGPSCQGRLRPFRWPCARAWSRRRHRN
jgi:hypothetical protein